jgi:shikimate kinase
VADLFREREALYARYADWVIDAGELMPEACARAILQRLRGTFPTAL